MVTQDIVGLIVRILFEDYRNVKAIDCFKLKFLTPKEQLIFNQFSGNQPFICRYLNQIDSHFQILNIKSIYALVYMQGF